MPALLRKRLVCFYCNHRSAITRDPGLDKFRCNNCDAINYLDENGDITDPPPTPTLSSSQTFATSSFSSSINPDFAPVDANIFCATCLKNQGFYISALASYLPDTSDPNYARYERKLPEYKANLEERYPQVCAKCVERVNNRINSMTYLTKAENLKVRLDKTRKGDVIRRDLGWKGRIVQLGGIAWYLSILGQLLWHVLGALSELPSANSHPRYQAVSIWNCVKQIARFGSVDQTCYEGVGDYTSSFLYAGMLSIWWNNRLRESQQGYGRLSHLNDYYLLQIIFFSIRCAAFWVLSHPDRFTLPFPALVAHSFTIVVSLTCMFSSLSIVQLRKPPVLADYKLNPVTAPRPDQEPLILDGPLNQAGVPGWGNSFSSFSPVAAPQTPFSSQTSGFPIAKLSSNQQDDADKFWTPRGRNRSPSMTSSSAFSAFLDERAAYDTGERESEVDFDVSEMDWTPTGPAGPSTLHTVRPMLERISETSPQASPSLFGRGRGTLPPAPAHPAHRAARPEQPSPFEERGLRKKGGLLADESESEADGDGSGFNLFGKRRGGKEKGLTAKLADRKEIPMADPKFHLLNMNGGEAKAKGRVEEETGLEGLFNSVFSLSDEPREVHDAHSKTARRRIMVSGEAVAEIGTRGNWRSGVWFAILLSVLLALAAFGAQGFASGVGLEGISRSWLSGIKRQAESLLPVRTVAATEDAFPIAAVDI